LLKRQRNQDLIGGLALVVEERPGTLRLVEDDELSWQRRRALYLDRLGSGNGFLVLAVEGNEVVGHALLASRTAPDDTFAVGERYAKVYSPSVAPQL
jgi:hypothetical protein